MKKSSPYLFAAVLLLSACTMHRIDIQQGNIITPEMLQEIKVGMNREQVQRLMGTPLIIDAFNNDRWIYLYSMQSTKKPPERRHVIIEFKDDKVARFTSSE